MVKDKKLRKNRLERISESALSNSFTNIKKMHNDWEYYENDYIGVIVRMCPYGNYSVGGVVYK